MLDHGGDVAGALAQRRHAQREDVEAVVEVVAELAGGDLGFQVDMRRGDHPHVECLDLIGAERLDLLFLQHAQQLGLQRQGQVADLVEEQRAAVGHLEFADARLAVGAGKGAGGGAEQFGLDQAFRNRRDVDRDEGPARPR